GADFVAEPQRFAGPSSSSFSAYPGNMVYLTRTRQPHRRFIHESAIERPHGFRQRKRRGRVPEKGDCEINVQKDPKTRHVCVKNQLFQTNFCEPCYRITMVWWPSPLSSFPWDWIILPASIGW